MQHRNVLPLFVLLALLAPLVGCGDAGHNTPKGGDAKDKAKEKQAPAKPMEVALKTLSTEDIMKAVEEQTGKIVVLDTWATWCVPCTKGFPHLVELHKKYSNKGVLCVSVTIDGEEQDKAALTFLKKVGAHFPNYRVASDAAWLEKWNIKGIPVVLVFENGKLVKKFDYDDPNNQFTYEDVNKLVEELLKKRPA